MPLPQWVKTQLKGIQKTQQYFKNRKINTVCETLRCPNRAACYKEKSATFMILGNRCTRRCRFCEAPKGNPEPVDCEEPLRIARATEELGLNYVIVTSCTRDDLVDGGAEHFVNTVKEIKKINSDTMVEVLVPDFKGSEDSIKKVVDSGVVVFAHNIETVQSLYGKIRDADYVRSLKVLEMAKKFNCYVITKSGLMLGLGEGFNEVVTALKDLRSSGCDILTVGQYLQPSKKALPVVEYIKVEIFEEIQQIALDLGFKTVVSGPLVRSSWNAYKVYLESREVVNTNIAQNNEFLGKTS